LQWSIIQSEEYDETSRPKTKNSGENPPDNNTTTCFSTDIFDNILGDIGIENICASSDSCFDSSIPDHTGLKKTRRNEKDDVDYSTFCSFAMSSISTYLGCKSSEYTSKNHVDHSTAYEEEGVEIIVLEEESDISMDTSSSSSI